MFPERHFNHGLLGTARAAPTQGDAGQATSASKSTIVASDQDALVETACGKVRGYISNGIFTYKGIPYWRQHYGKRALSASPKSQALDRSSQLHAIRQSMSAGSTREVGTKMKNPGCSVTTTAFRERAACG